MQERRENTETDPERQQNSRRRSLTNHYDVILIECFANHSPSCILIPFWICLCKYYLKVSRKYINKRTYTLFEVFSCSHQQECQCDINISHFSWSFKNSNSGYLAGGISTIYLIYFVYTHLNIFTSSNINVFLSFTP